MTQTKIILLACGSFNPPTYMHLRMFELAKDHLNRLENLEVIAGLISPVHDNYCKKDLESSTHRCALVKLAIKNSDWIHLSDWECKQSGWSKTKEVLQYHQNLLNSIIHSNGVKGGTKRPFNDDHNWTTNIMRQHQNCEDIKIKLLCGGDLLETFATPGLWADADIESIVRDHGLIVITRNGTNPFRFIYESDILSKYQKNINIITEWITNEISSTKIRRSLRRGESVKYLLSDEVINYIKNNAIYGTITENNNYQQQLTPSPNDIDMKSTAIDMPDAVTALVEDNGKCTNDNSDSDDSETRVLFQISEDGQIQVISDKETTV